MNGKVADLDKRLSILEPSVTTAHERIDDLDKRTEGQAQWIARNDGKEQGMRGLITLGAALAAAIASIIKLFSH